MPDLTPALRLEIVARVETGAFPEVAAAASGVKAVTFAEWMSRGTNPPPGDRTRKYRTLAAAVALAEATAEGRLLAAVADGDPKTAAQAEWILERRWPERWAKRMGRPPAAPAEPTSTPKPSVVDELAARRGSTARP